MSNLSSPSKDLTRLIIGALFEAYNEMGYGYQEKHYYRAILAKLQEKGLFVQEQLLCQIIIAGKNIGKYYLDFLVSDKKDKVVVEIKVANGVYSQHIKQVLNYLKVNNLKIGIIGVFSKNGVIVKRVAN
jgi:GxxExxY protein